jgi:hypothetical protein
VRWYDTSRWPMEVRSCTGSERAAHTHTHSHTHARTCPAGRAVAQAASRRLPASGSSHVGSAMDSGTGAGFLRVLRFPLPLMHSTK